MLSINTNISSLIAQSSMKTSSQLLNQAVERMSTGYKINHAKDNAANYSIATNMSAKISSYEVAADNVAMGMDMVTTASDIVSQMQGKGERLRSLAMQARNGTYGAQSLTAINTEASAIMAEINRLYITSEYNGIKLFDLGSAAIASQISEPVMMFATRASEPVKPEAKAEYNGFISNPKTYEDSYVDGLTAVSDATLTAGGIYKIASKNDFSVFIDYLEAGNDTANMTFVLANDIDLSGFKLSYSTRTFGGVLDGNGYALLSPSCYSYGYASFDGIISVLENDGVIQNLAIDEPDFGQDYETTILVGDSYGTVNNCYISDPGYLTAYGGFAGLVANNLGDISSCYVKYTDVIDISVSMYPTGGLVQTNSGNITNSFCEYSEFYLGVMSNAGLVAENSGSIDNCYVTADTFYTLEDCEQYGGLVGLNMSSGIIKNSEFVGNFEGAGVYIGGLVGENLGEIQNCRSEVNLQGKSKIGGLVGTNSGVIVDSESEGSVSGETYVGGLVGYNTGTIINSKTSATVEGDSYVGGLVGQVNKTSGTLNLTNCTSNATVVGTNSESTGNFIGGVVNTTNGTSFGTVNIENCIMEPKDATAIGGCFNTSDVATGYDMSQMLSGINPVNTPPTPGGGTGSGALPAGAMILQVGLSGSSSSQIGFDVSFSYDLSAIGIDISSDDALSAIDDFINQLSAQETKLGAVQNRLESALDSIAVNIENLTSSLSTIRDADIAEVSSTYIQQQILQQASATLLATANQSPSIALQLI